MQERNRRRRTGPVDHHDLGGPGSSILSMIGNTPMVALRTIVPAGHARILVKMESENPTGSMKDRMALAIIEAAERDGRLAAGGRVVEYTGGSTGVSLAMVCAVKDHPLSIVTSDAFSGEKRAHMAALGAALTEIESDGGALTEALTRSMIYEAKRIVAETGGFWADQLNNTDPIDAYHVMGEEIWAQAEGQVDAFVHSIGTAGSIRGAAEALRRRNPNIHIVGVEPAESAVLSGGATGGHRIEGIGAGFVVPLWQPETVDELVTVSSNDAMKMSQRLARSEGLFAGTSTGANLIATLNVARRLGPGATVATLMCDSGIKYLSTELYRRHP